jgi:hypothetical protein
MPENKQASPVADVLLTVVLPSAALEWLSEPSRLGPFWALVVAAMLPIGFGVYCYVTRSGLNFFSILGLVAVIITGGLGLLKLDAFWFAIKEACVPVFLGLAFPLSHRWGRPLIESILLTPQLINRAVLQRALVTPEQKESFAALLLRASWGMGSGMLLSAGGNFALAMHLLGGKEPGSEAFVKAIGTLNWTGFVIIGVPLFGIMFVVLMWFLRAVHRLTGLDRDDLMNPGKTVRKTVHNQP